MKLVLTIHAKQRMDQHGISEELVRTTIQQGAKVPQTDGFLASYAYIKVAYKIRSDKYIIKTVMVER